MFVLFAEPLWCSWRRQVR